MKYPGTLKNEARDEAYIYFDKYIRKLHKKSDGSIDTTVFGLEGNDVDAFRHAYVSGVFTQEYNEAVADIFGRLNENNPFDLYSNSKDPRALNMDLWNNAVGRKYGSKNKNREDLLKKIHEALKNKELIIDIEDTREYTGAKHNPINKSKPVVVLLEAEKGRNEVFFDMVKNRVLSREEFIIEIQNGNYPGYTIKNIKGVLTPVSMPDGRQTNNLS